MNANIDFNMPIEEYLKLEGLSPSDLLNILTSPLYYQHRKKEELEETDDMRLGRYVHTLVLEPQKEADSYAHFQGARRQGKIWESFAHEHRAKTILTTKQYDNGQRMRDAIRSHPVASHFLSGGVAEAVLQWRDGHLSYRMRPDFIRDDHQTIVDIKTTKRIEPHPFGGTAARLGYHIKAAHYAAGWEAYNGNRPTLLFVAVQSEAPYDVVVYQAFEDSLSAGEWSRQLAIQKFVECQSSGRWPGIGDQILPLTLPGWVVSGGNPEFNQEVYE